MLRALPLEPFPHTASSSCSERCAQATVAASSRRPANHRRAGRAVAAQPGEGAALTGAPGAGARAARARLGALAAGAGPRARAVGRARRGGWGGRGGRGGGELSRGAAGAAEGAQRALGAAAAGAVGLGPELGSGRGGACVCGVSRAPASDAAPASAVAGGWRSLSPARVCGRRATRSFRCGGAGTTAACAGAWCVPRAPRSARAESGCATSVCRTAAARRWA